MKHRILLLIVLLLLGNSMLYAQISGTVNGTVCDKNHLPVIGVSVVVEGGSEGTITNRAGEYSLRVQDNATLSFSSVGYKTQSVRVGMRTRIDIVLEEDKTVLDEIVVVGYGTQKKANLTGAVDVITDDVFDGRPKSNVTQMLQGAIPNLNLTLTDGRPYRSATYNIRGTTSVGQGGSALVLIDGIEGNPALLNPDDIASVTVLKDAASSAIYGSRAPYGVVLITTKSAKKGRAQINYSTSFAFEQPTSTMDYETDGYTYASHFYEAYSNYHHKAPSNINKSQQFSTAWLEEYRIRKENGTLGTVISDGSWGTTAGRWVYFNDSTDYFGALYKERVATQTHNISISGGEEKFDYYLSGRYYGYGGLFDSQTNTDDYSMINMRMKVGYQIYSWLKITDNLDISRRSYNTPMTYSEGNGNVWRNLFDEGHPSSPLWNPDNTMTYSAVYSIGDLLYGKSRQTRDDNTVRNTLGFQMNFLDGKLRVNGDVSYRDLTIDRTIKRVRTPYSKTAGVVETISGTQSDISETCQSTKNLVVNDYIEYEDTFGKHYLKAMVGYNYEESTLKSLYASNDDLLVPEVENIKLAMGTNNSISSAWKRWRSVGLFARFNYVFDNRYLLEINGRYDGSSKFMSRSRWALFPSVSVGWKLSSEDWFEVDPAAVSNVKLRASYGSLGNSNIDPYSFDEVFAVNKGRIINGEIVRYTSAPTPFPENLTWETSKTADIGIDLGFLDNRLNLTADIYERRTINMYIVGPTLPDVYGASSPKGNYGEMTTRGYELSLAWNGSFRLGGKPFHYNIRATLADYISTIDKYNNTTKNIGSDNSPAYYEGMTVGEIWGYVSNGLWQTEAEIDAAEAAATAAGQKCYNPVMNTDNKNKLHPGDIKFEDLNGNHYIDRGKSTVDDPGDRRIIGNSEPRYIYGFNLNTDWNNMFFSIFIQGVGKQDWYPSNDASSFWGQYGRPYCQMPRWHNGNYWTEENTDAYLPRYTGYYEPLYKGSKNANTRYLQDVSYVRLKNIQVGFILPARLINRLGLKKASIFFSGENLWAWSPLYRHTRDVDVANIYGTDVDLTSTGDGYNYPTMKSYSIGLNITF